MSSFFRAGNNITGGSNRVGGWGGRWWEGGVDGGGRVGVDVGLNIRV